MHQLHRNYSIMYPVFIITALLIIALTWNLQAEVRFRVLTYLLITYTVLEVIHTLTTDKILPLLNPAMLASIMTFGLSFGLSNFIYFYPQDEFIYNLLGDSPFEWMNRAMICALLGIFAMWQGYRSVLGKQIAAFLDKTRLLRKMIRQEYRLSWPFIVMCLVISLCSRLFQVSLGIFGYSSEMDQLFALASYRQYIDIGVSLGSLALIGLSLAQFSSKHHNPVLYITFLGSLLFEIAFGFLSGFKSGTIFPLIIVGLCYYKVKRRVPIKLIFASVVLIFVAHAIIEPFRTLRHKEASFRTRDIKSISSFIVEQTKLTEFSTAYIKDIYEKYNKEVISRMALTSMAARAIQYKEEVGLSEDDPAFLKNIFFAPAYAFIPRFIWPTKPKSMIGIWFAKRVTGQPEEVSTSTAMSPIGYLYFAGGWVAVYLGLAVIGIFQRVLYEKFARASSGSFIIFLGLFHPLVNIDSAFDTIGVTLLRFFPLLLIAQYLVFKR